MKQSGNKTVGPVKLGITGGVGSGKSFVCDYLKEKGLRVVSADELARKAVLPGTEAYNKIVDYFGEQVLLDDRSLNRKKLRGIITQDKKKKEMLEQFVHPEVFLQMSRQIERSTEKQEPVIAIEVPLLFETGMEVFFDCVVTVSVNPDIRIDRVMARDRISRQDAQALMKIQMPEEEKIKKSDFVIDNNGSIEQTQLLIDQFIDTFMDKIKID